MPAFDSATPGTSTDPAHCCLCVWSLHVPEGPREAPWQRADFQANFGLPFLSSASVHHRGNRTRGWHIPFHLFISCRHPEHPATSGKKPARSTFWCLVKIWFPFQGNQWTWPDKGLQNYLSYVHSKEIKVWNLRTMKACGKMSE